MCAAETFEVTDPAAVGTHAGRTGAPMALEGTVVVSSVPSVPSGPRNWTLSVRSAVLVGVMDPMEIVSRSSEQLRAAIGVSTPLCATRTYSTCDETTLE